MYDPFAAPNQPPPGTMVAQHNQVMPNPVPVSTNNALAALYNKHMTNMIGPNGTPPNGQFPLNPGGPMQGDWRQQYQHAMGDWRGQMPDHPTFDGTRPPDWGTQMGAYQGQRNDWRDLRPQRRDFRIGTVPTTGF